MSDSVPQKRVLPPRERRESANKRRDLTPPVKASSSPTPKKPGPAKSTLESTTSRRGTEYTRGPYNTKKKNLATVVVRDVSTPGVEEVLPTRLVDSRPLPTLRTQQPEALSDKEYQSIAQSAVLAAALHRSRMKWLCDGIFEKFWTKPTKKKGAPEAPANNPDQKSMSKLGIVTLTIEPHVFDATFYTVRELPPGPPPQPKQQVKHTPSTPGYYPSPGWGPPPPPPQQIPTSPLQNVPDRTIVAGARPPGATNDSVQHSPPLTQQSTITDTEDIKMKGGSILVRPIMHTRDIRLRGGGPGPPAPSPIPATDPPKPNTDPVIQMLASRAATDPHLKELMKQVATSKASPAQLKEFQSHIDEFNAIIKGQESPPKRPGPGRPPSKYNTPASKPPTPTASHPSMYSSPAPPTGRGTPIYSTPTPGFGPYPPHPVSRPAPRPEPSITAIVFELTTAPFYSQPASQDRWLFPPYAVLDTPHSGRGLEMIMSWFVERTGARIKQSLGITVEDEAGFRKWKDDTTYYQPVTMKLNSAVHKPLMTIAVNAKSLQDVQKHMEKTMKEKTRAREEWLVLRLPKPGVDLTGSADADGEKFQDSGVEVGWEEEDELKDFYGVP